MSIQHRLTVGPVLAVIVLCVNTARIAFLAVYVMIQVIIRLLRMLQHRIINLRIRNGNPCVNVGILLPSKDIEIQLLFRDIILFQSIERPERNFLQNRLRNFFSGTG